MRHRIGDPSGHRQKILFGFLVLGLILACAPAGITPSPPSDPNAVQLFIQQTAGAAATQTERAVPTTAATATLTSTPRSTFTTEPTYTPFTFILPTLDRSQKVQYFRVKHDNQLAIYNFKSRTVGPEWGYLKQTPEVAPLYPEPKEGTGTHRTPVDGAWEVFLNGLNDNDRRKLIFLKSASTALFNGAGFPQMESLTMGGNIITLEAIQNGWGKVHTMDYGSPPSVASVNYFTDPNLVHKIVLVTWNTKTKTTYWVNPPQGSIYWPFVARNEVWIQMDRLEPFPILPMQVTALIDQPILKEPSLDSAPTQFNLDVGGTTNVVQYRPSGPDVWGRLENGNWIKLFRYEKGVPTYYTTWSMATVPPPP